MFEPITIKQVFNRSGDFEYLELWQGENCLKVSLGNTKLETHKDYSKWGNLRSVIDRHAQEVSDRAWAVTGDSV